MSLNAAGGGFPELIQGVSRVTVLDAPMLAHMKGRTEKTWEPIG
ncbi:MAG: hypothetical protein ABI903_12570 [Actinomycetota bacterium]